MKAVPFLIATFAAATIATSANAFDQAAAQQACGNDVFAMCQQDIPDQGRITACLRKNYSRVSAPCRSFMAVSAREMRRGGHRETTASAVREESSPRARYR
jgi:hypothetical protein